MTSHSPRIRLRTSSTATRPPRTQARTKRTFQPRRRFSSARRPAPLLGAERLKCFPLPAEGPRRRPAVPHHGCATYADAAQQQQLEHPRQHYPHHTSCHHRAEALARSSSTYRKGPPNRQHSHGRQCARPTSGITQGGRPRKAQQPASTPLLTAPRDDPHEGAPIADRRAEHAAADPPVVMSAANGRVRRSTLQALSSLRTS